MNWRKPVTVVALLAWALLLGTWSPQSAAILQCCYHGDSVEMRLTDLQVRLEDGQTVSFQELFPDFESSTSFFTLTYPVFKLDIARVVYAHLSLKFIDYDANGNGAIEEPELTVLYIEEAARGLGQPIAQLGAEGTPRAIFAPAGDIDGLIRLVNRRRSEMDPDARKTFDEIDLLRIDFRIDGTEPGEQGDGSFTP